MEKLGEEYVVVGFYLLGYLLDDYLFVLWCKNVQMLVEVMQVVMDGVLVVLFVGMVVFWQEKKFVCGICFVFVGLFDLIGFYEVMVFFDMLDVYCQYLELGVNVVLQVQVEFLGDQVKLLVCLVMLLEQVVVDVGVNWLVVEIIGFDVIFGIVEVLVCIQVEVNVFLCVCGLIMLWLKDGDDLVDIEIIEDVFLIIFVCQVLWVVLGVFEVLEE